MHSISSILLLLKPFRSQGLRGVLFSCFNLYLSITILMYSHNRRLYYWSLVLYFALSRRIYGSLRLFNIYEGDVVVNLSTLIQGCLDLFGQISRFSMNSLAIFIVPSFINEKVVMVWTTGLYC